MQIAITGHGVVSPFGMGAAAWSEGVRAGKPVFGAPTCFDAGEYPGARVAEVRGFDPTPVLGDKGLRNLDRLTKLFLVATREALGRAGVRREGKYAAYEGTRVGVCGSTAYGSVETMTELHRVAVLENPRYLNPAKF